MPKTSKREKREAENSSERRITRRKTKGAKYSPVVDSIQDEDLEKNWETKTRWELKEKETKAKEESEREVWQETKTYFIFMLFQHHKLWGDQSLSSSHPLSLVKASLICWNQRPRSLRIHGMDEE